MKTTTELELVPHKSSLPDARREPTASDMLNAILTAIQSGDVTAEKVAAMDGAMKLCERMQDKEAERLFNQAFIRLQKIIPSVKADKVVEDSSGKKMYAYCTFKEIYAQVGNALLDNGFCVSFSQTLNEGGTLTESCTLMHEGGFSRTNYFTVRAGAGTRAMSSTQIDEAASTAAQREAFCDALNIIRVERDDPRQEGSPITLAQAEELHRRVSETESDEFAFLKVAGITGISGKPTLEHYKGIMSNKYAMLDSLLAKKEARGR